MFDVHVHTAPDVVPRLADDAATVDRYEQAGFRGCVLKGHVDATASRAAVVGAGRGLAVYGGVALNRWVGGLNPAAVAACLALGGRVIWLPTVDAATHVAAGLPRPQVGVAPAGYGVPPVDPGAEGAVGEILTLVAEADAVLATGHLSGPELSWLVPRCRTAGVRRVLLTHPSWTVPGLGSAEVRALTDLGALAEVTAYQLLHQPGWDAARLAGFVRAVGIRRCVLSSDAGQVGSPPPPEALAGLVEALAGEGLDRGALRAAASEVPEALVTP